MMLASGLHIMSKPGVVVLSQKSALRRLEAESVDSKAVLGYTKILCLKKNKINK